MYLHLFNIFRLRESLPLRDLIQLLVVPQTMREIWISSSNLVRQDPRVVPTVEPKFCVMTYLLRNPSIRLLVRSQPRDYRYQMR